MKLWYFPLLLLFAAESVASVKITTTKLPSGTVGASYSAAIEAEGGCTPYKWSVVSGTLPKGVKAVPSKSSTSLDLSGTPTTAAKYSFKILVSACGGHSFEESYEVTIESENGHAVDLTWDASTSKDVAGYNVYRGLKATSLQKINASLVASTLYDDLSVANGTTYYYAVATVDIHGDESAKTQAVEVVVP